MEKNEMKGKRFKITLHGQWYLRKLGYKNTDFPQIAFTADNVEVTNRFGNRTMNTTAYQKLGQEGYLAMCARASFHGTAATEKGYMANNPIPMGTDIPTGYFTDYGLTKGTDGGTR